MLEALIPFGLSMLNKAFSPEAKNPIPKPVRGDYVMSNADASGLRQNYLSDLNQMNMGNVSAMKQLAATGRTSEGGALAGLSGLGYETARGAKSIEPELDRMKRDSLIQYNQALAQYQQGQAQTDAANQERYNFTPELGMLGQALMTKDIWGNQNNPVVDPNASKGLFDSGFNPLASMSSNSQYPQGSNYLDQYERGPGVGRYFGNPMQSRTSPLSMLGQ
jgi:hypothetical protein